MSENPLPVAAEALLLGGFLFMVGWFAARFYQKWRDGS